MDYFCKGFDLRFWIKRHFPKWHANRLYKSRFKRNINWKKPIEFNEKLRWLQFNGDTSKWSLLADKYRVRKYMTERGYGDLLVNLYGIWKNPDDINFEKLPQSFVLKTNHGSGSVYIVKNKDKEDLESIRESLRKDLKDKFGIESAEPHYLKIAPVVMAEELLVQDGKSSNSLIDYKFYCVNGEPQFCGVMFNRDIYNHTYNVRLYDNDWKDISGLLSEKTDRGKYGVDCPKNFELMKKFCREVCKEFPFVRMDFYECDGHLYFGEFTFTPAACTGGSLGVEACRILSDRLLLSTI